MQAKALTAYPINAFTGRELVRYEWRLVPAGYEAEAQRLEEAGLVELRRGGGTASGEPPVVSSPDFIAPAGFPGGDKLPVNISSDSVKIEQPPTLSVDLESLTIVQLKDMAREQGVTGFSTMKKAELVDALRDD